MGEPAPHDWMSDAKALAEERFKRGNDQGLIPTLYVRRSGSTPLTLVVENARLLGSLASLAAPAFESDELIFMADTYASPSDVNPEGQPWTVGEMEARAVELGSQLRSTLIVIRVLRAELAVKAQAVPYELEGRDVKWGQAEDLEMPLGYLVRLLRDALALPTLRTMFDLAGIESDLEQREQEVGIQIGAVQAIVSVAKRAHSSVGFAMVAPEDPKLKALVERRLNQIKNMWL